MKLLVFAHVPPPLHGQSQMVLHLVEGLRRDPALGVEVEHVDARVSEDLADVGRQRGGKLWRLLRHCARAVGLRWSRRGLGTWYYVPSPPKRASLYRDWIVMALVRPWFGRTVFHWHAVGLGEWLEREARPWERRVSHWLLGGADLAIVLSEFSAPDARRFAPRAVVVVPNGIPDPCPDFASTLAARRGRAPGGGGVVRVLFLAHNTRDKGLFDALETVALANRRAAERPGSPRFELVVAGGFVTPGEESEYRSRVAQPDLAGVVRHAGFVTGADKDRVLREAEVFLFPTWFANEGQPLNLIEAMAYGLPLVTTRWRGIPGMIPPGVTGPVEPQDIPRLADALAEVAASGLGVRYRGHFEREFSLTAHLAAMARVLRSVGGESRGS